jgi:hypothetical protein
MLGGQEVNVTGPCFWGVVKFLCKWGDFPDAKITVGEKWLIDDEHIDYKARCVQPLMYYNGRLNLSVSLDNGETFQWKGEYNVGIYA